MRFVEEIRERMADSRAHIFDADMVGDRLVALRLAVEWLVAQGDDFVRQVADGAEPGVALQQIARRHRADMANAKTKEQTRSVRLTLGLDRGEQVVDRLFLPALAAQ